MDLVKVNRLNDEIKGLSYEEFMYVRDVVNNIMYHGNPNWEKPEHKPVSVGAEMVRRMIAAAEAQ